MLTRVSSIKVYYTVDDGRTWFADDSGKPLPFDHNGQMAVRCFVFKCSTSAPFVGYLETLTKASDPSSVSSGAAVLVKKPGARDWAPIYSRDGLEITGDIRCPDGSGERPQPVSP